MSDEDTEYAKRELRRSVRYIADAADLMAREHTLYHMDDLPNMAGTGRHQKMRRCLKRSKKQITAPLESLMLTPFETGCTP